MGSMPGEEAREGADKQGKSVEGSEVKPGNDRKGERKEGGKKKEGEDENKEDDESALTEFSVTGLSLPAERGLEGGLALDVGAGVGRG